jgi:hypothetical protein
MKEEILKLMMEYWEEYKDSLSWSSDASFEGFMSFLETKIK